MTLPPLPPGTKALEFIGSTEVYSWSDITGYAAAAVAAERERWRAVAHRVAADANRYGCEGLRMRCTISDTGALVSWEVSSQ